MKCRETGRQGDQLTGSIRRVGADEQWPISGYRIRDKPRPVISPAGGESTAAWGTVVRDSPAAVRAAAVYPEVARAAVPSRRDWRGTRSSGAPSTALQHPRSAEALHESGVGLHAMSSRGRRPTPDGLTASVRTWAVLSGCGGEPSEAGGSSDVLSIPPQPVQAATTNAIEDSTSISAGINTQGSLPARTPYSFASGCRLGGRSASATSMVQALAVTSRRVAQTVAPSNSCAHSPRSPPHMIGKPTSENVCDA